MARFTKYWPTQAALDASPAYPSTYRAPFIGWDSIRQGERSTEATEARDLNKPMSATDAGVFGKLEPGERINRDGIVYAHD